MKHPTARLALLVASAAALTLVATPAVASTAVPSESVATAASAPTGVVSPARSSWAYLLATGVTDRFTHLAPGATYTLGWFGGADVTKAQMGGAALDAQGDPMQVTAAGDGTASVNWKGGGIEGVMGVVTVDLIDSQGAWVAKDQLEVKKGSHVVWVSSHRAGRDLTIHAKAEYWSLASKSLHTWPKKTVLFQERIAGVWHTVATAKTDGNGLATATVHGGAHAWRLVLLPTAATFRTASTPLWR